MNDEQWLAAEMQAACILANIAWQSFVDHIGFRDDLPTVTGKATAAFHVDENLETRVYVHPDVQTVALLSRQKLLLHELYHAVQFDRLVSFFQFDKQKAAAFHKEVCRQQSGFATLYARNEVEAEVFALYTLMRVYGRQSIAEAGLIDEARRYLRGYSILGDRSFPRSLRAVYGDNIEDLFPSPDSATDRHKNKNSSS